MSDSATVALYAAMVLADQARAWAVVLQAAHQILAQRHCTSETQFAQAARSDDTHVCPSFFALVQHHLDSYHPSVAPNSPSAAAAARIRPWLAGWWA